VVAVAASCSFELRHSQKSHECSFQPRITTRHLRPQSNSTGATERQTEEDPFGGLLTIAFILVPIQVGQQLGRRAVKRSGELHDAPVGSVVGAALGLLAFTLAFTFQIARFGKVSHNFCLTLTRDFAQLRKVVKTFSCPRFWLQALNSSGDALGRISLQLADLTGRHCWACCSHYDIKVCERRIFRTTLP